MNKPKIHAKFSRVFFTEKFPVIHKNGLLWKDKFGTPRVERVPMFELYWLNFSFTVWKGDDMYWEQWLWIHNYNGGDEAKAEQTWPWKDVETGISSWKNNF